MIGVDGMRHDLRLMLSRRVRSSTYFFLRILSLWWHNGGGKLYRGAGAARGGSRRGSCTSPGWVGVS